MSIIDFDWLPSWTLDKRENWREHKIPMGRGGPHHPYP